MLAALLARSSGSQRAGIVRMLLVAAGPQVLRHVLERFRRPELTRAAAGDITPEVAQSIPDEALQEVAVAAEKRDPSVIDRVSSFYAEQPQLVKTLGAAALTVALAHFANKQTMPR
jgi:hypothetical protein